LELSKPNDQKKINCDAVIDYDMHNTDSAFAS